MSRLCHDSFRVAPEVFRRINDIVKAVVDLEDHGGIHVWDLSVGALGRAATAWWLTEATQYSDLELIEQVRPFALRPGQEDGRTYYLGMRLTPKLNAAVRAVVGERVGPRLHHTAVKRAILSAYIVFSNGFTPAEHLERIRPWIVPRGQRVPSGALLPSQGVKC